MGMVFVGYDDELERKVAIKLLRQVASGDSIGRARLLREAQTLARLSHVNVVAVYEVGEFERQIYIAMEYVPGQTLQAWMQARRRSWRDVVGVFIEAGRGLAAAHAAQILHRDFKPANVLIGDDGRVRVVDFGLALTREALEGPSDVVATHIRLRDVTGAHDSASRRSLDLTEVGSIVGTPAYMAPERFALQRDLDPRSDQFAFCVALFEALHGARPFPGRSYDEIRAVVLRGNIVAGRWRTRYDSIANAQFHCLPPRRIRSASTTERRQTRIKPKPQNEALGAVGAAIGVPVITIRYVYSASTPFVKGRWGTGSFMILVFRSALALVTLVSLLARSTPTTDDRSVETPTHPSRTTPASTAAPTRNLEVSSVDIGLAD